MPREAEGEMNDAQRSLLSVPCYRDALLVGAASGLAVGLHRFYGTRNVVRAADWSIKMMCATSLVSFGVCRWSFHESKVRVQESLGELREKQRRQRQEAPPQGE